MKKLILFFAFAGFFSCKNEAKKKAETTAEVATTEKGQQLFEGNNCTACHKIDEKVIGPGLQQIAEVYKSQKGDMVAFLKEEAPPIVDEKLFQTMKINLQLTKTMSDAELESLEMYIMGHAK